MIYIGKEIRRQPLVITGSDSSTFLKVEQKELEEEEKKNSV